MVPYCVICTQVGRITISAFTERGEPVIETRLLCGCGQRFASRSDAASEAVLSPEAGPDAFEWPETDPAPVVH